MSDIAAWHTKLAPLTKCTLEMTDAWLVRRAFFMLVLAQEALTVVVDEGEDANPIIDDVKKYKNATMCELFSLWALEEKDSFNDLYRLEVMCMPQNDDQLRDVDSSLTRCPRCWRLSSQAKRTVGGVLRVTCLMCLNCMVCVICVR